MKEGWEAGRHVEAREALLGSFNVLQCNVFNQNATFMADSCPSEGCLLGSHLSLPLSLLSRIGEHSLSLVSISY